MQEFIARHKDGINGTLSGFDRLVFRGTLRSIAYVDGMRNYLHRNGVLLKDFGPHVGQVSERVKKASPRPQPPPPTRRATESPPATA